MEPVVKAVGEEPLDPIAAPEQPRALDADILDTGDVHAGDLLAVRVAEVGIVERLRGTGRQVGNVRDQLGAHALADQRRRGLLRRTGLGGDRAEHDASVADHVVLQPGRHRHPEHGEIERAAPPQLEVCRAPTLGRRELEVGDDLVRPLGEVVDPVVLIEGGHRHRALALRADEPELRAERPEHRRGV